MTFKGESDNESVKSLQDIQFIVCVVSHIIFEREKENLIYERIIWLWDGLCVDVVYILDLDVE
jgi:hypothetical protein